MIDHTNLSRVVACTLSCVFLLLCKDIERPPLLPYLLGLGTGGGIGVVSSDLGSAGRFGTMTHEGIPRPGQINIHSDAVARYGNGRVYIINRLNRDNIQVLNPSLFYQTESEFSTGILSNPHDIVLAHPQKAYITLYEKNYLYIVNPATGLQIGQIDLAPFADADGIPEMSGMLATDTRVYVAVQRLNRNAGVGTFPPTDHSSLLELDRESGAVLREYHTPATNPFNKLRRMSLFGQDLIVFSCPAGIGANFDTAGGIVAFDLNLKAFRSGFFYSEAAAGGDILDFAIHDESTGYAAVQFSDFSTAIHRFNPTTGEKLATLTFYPSSAGYVAGMLVEAGKLYAGDATFSRPGVVIYDVRTDVKITPTPVEVGLRPTDLILVPKGF